MKVRSGHLYQRKAGGPFYIQIRVDGKMITKRLTDEDGNPTANRRDAEKLKAVFMQPYLAGDAVDTLKAVQVKLADRQAEVDAWQDAENPPPELNQIWSRFMASPARPDSGESTLKVYSFKWQRFKTWLRKNHPAAQVKIPDGKEPPIYLRDVTKEQAALYAADLTTAKLSASSYNQHRNLLRMIWRVLAEESRLTDGNPWDGIHPRKLTALATRKRAITKAQFETLLTAVEGTPDLKDLFTVLAWTGLRLGDAVLMQWCAVDFPQKVITVAPMKTARRQGKQVFIPMFPAVLDILNRRQAGQVLNPAGYVFPVLAATYQRDPSAISKDVSKAFDKAGMQTTEQRAGRGKAVIVFGAHSLRHFFVTEATAAGMPGAMIRSITGHDSNEMLTHYQQIGVDLAADLAARIQDTTAQPKAITDGPAGDPLDVLRGLVRELAEQLTVDNVEEIRMLLNQAVSS